MKFFWLRLVECELFSPCSKFLFFPASPVADLLYLARLLKYVLSLEYDAHFDRYFLTS